MKKWFILSSLLVLFMSVAAWGGWTLLSADKIDEPRNSQPVTKAEETSDEDKEDFSTEIVNKPASKDIVVFSSIEFENGHEFIAEFHEFYNDTLCWGRVKTAEYKEQQDAAARIVEAIQEVVINNDNLYDDFALIENSANQVISSDDREAMVSLHRLFHDLDIYLNGYSKDNTFGVTQFKGV